MDKTAAKSLSSAAFEIHIHEGIQENSNMQDVYEMDRAI